MRQFCEAKIRLIREGARPLPGVPEVLERARAAGYRLALASSAELPIIAATVETLGLAAASSSASPARRCRGASPRPTSSWRRRGAWRWPRGTASWWRTRATGCSPARAAGMRCAVVPCSATLGHDFTDADYRLRSLADLLPLLIPR